MIEWKQTQDPIDYGEAERFMAERAAAIHHGNKDECIWFLEHPALITKGTSADVKDLVEPERFRVYETGRGGQYTYHGPGQRVIYVMLNLKHYRMDVRWFVATLEEWVIKTLAKLEIKAKRSPGQVGIWVSDPIQPFKRKKIGAIGIRLKRWVSFHGISLNIDPDLSHYDAIVPCGISEYGVTSLKELGIEISNEELDELLKETFYEVFEATNHKNELSKDLQ